MYLNQALDAHSRVQGPACPTHGEGFLAAPSVFVALQEVFSELPNPSVKGYPLDHREKSGTFLGHGPWKRTYECFVGHWLAVRTKRDATAGHGLDGTSFVNRSAYKVPRKVRHCQLGPPRLLGRRERSPEASAQLWQSAAMS